MKNPIVSYLVQEAVVGAAETVGHNVLVNIVEAVGHHDVDPDVGDQDDQEAVDEGGARDQSNGDKPEPQEDIDLLVDDVESEDAETVLVLDGARGTILVEGALGHLGLKLNLDYLLLPEL